MRSMGVRFRSIITLAIFNGYIPMRNNISWVVAFALSPISYIFLLVMIGRYEMISYGFVGGLVMAMSASSYGLIGDIIWYRINLKLQDLFLATPAPSWAYILGLSLSAYVWASPSLAGFILIGYVIGVLRDITILGIIIALTTVLWINTASTAFLLSTFIRSEKYVWPLSSILGLVLSVFPPVYYPLTILPKEIWFVALTPPTASTAFLIEVYTGMISVDLIYVVYAVLNLMLQTIVFALLFIRRSKIIEW
ncbi:MAG: ABC transporter permease [Sulfolobales archaeon]